MFKVDLNFKTLQDTIKHQEPALDYSKAHLFLVRTQVYRRLISELVHEVDENAY